MRRKAASLLVYLATRQAYTANREQVLDDLWPEADPASGINSLNQSLYFLRREIDPWYEDELSIDYVVFGGDLLWLDPELVSTDSSEFLKTAKRIRSGEIPAPDVPELMRLYVGTFAPEFEYEEWAIDWRSRVHSGFLEAAHAGIDRLTQTGDLARAREVATAVLDVDPSVTDIERRLISLLWQSGARSAAKSQYEHLIRVEARDGVEVESFEAVAGDAVSRNTRACV
jgi:two-component SAPR family response regulator